MDEYYKQFIYEDHKSAIQFIKLIQFIMGLLTLICLLQKNIVGVIFAVSIFILTILYSNKELVEFEYNLCDNNFKIYKIVCEKRRVLIDDIDLENIKKTSKISEYLKSNGALNCYVGETDQYTLLMMMNIKKGKENKYVVAVDERMLKNLKRINPSMFMFF